MLKRKPSPKHRTVLIFSDANEANGFLNLLNCIVNNEKSLTVADLYFLLGMEPSNEDWNAGWKYGMRMETREIIFSKKHKLILPKLNYAERR